MKWAVSFLLLGLSSGSSTTVAGTVVVGDEFALFFLFLFVCLGVLLLGRFSMVMSEERECFVVVVVIVVCLSIEGGFVFGSCCR